MREEIEEIRSALVSIGALDDSTRDALHLLEDSLEEIDAHPAGDRVREVASETATAVKERGQESAVSQRWNSLEEHLEEWEDHHPKVTLVVGRMAEALSVVGL